MKRSFLLVTFLCAVFLVVGGQAPKEAEDRAPTQFHRQLLISTGGAPYPSYLLPATFGIGQQLFHVRPRPQEPLVTAYDDIDRVVLPQFRPGPAVSETVLQEASLGCTKIASAPAPNENKTVESDLLSQGSTITRQIGPCNDLETEINKERARNGLGPLKCDHNMRWVANKHVGNQLDNGYTDGQEFQGCNGHSWLGAVGCCFSISSEATWPCMWNKPLELSKWDDRNGYEISAWSSGTITPSGAVDSWRGSSAHHDVILTQGTWTDLQTVGCAWRKTVAHCWFAKTEP